MIGHLEKAHPLDTRDKLADSDMLGAIKFYRESVSRQFIDDVHR